MEKVFQLPKKFTAKYYRTLKDINFKIYHHQEKQRKSIPGSEEEKEHTQARNYWINVRSKKNSLDG